MTGDIVDTIDHALRDWETSPDAMRWAPTADADQADADAAHLSYAFPARWVLGMPTAPFLTVDLQPFQDELARALEVVLDWVIANRRLIDAWRGLPSYDDHHPKPLPINGQDYHRRRRARRRR